jgi:hypothetical protein
MIRRRAQQGDRVRGGVAVMARADVLWLFHKPSGRGFRQGMADGNFGREHQR